MLPYSLFFQPRPPILRVAIGSQARRQILEKRGVLGIGTKRVTPGVGGVDQANQHHSGRRAGVDAIGDVGHRADLTWTV